MNDIKEIGLKDIKSLINNIKDNEIISVDLTSLLNDKNVTESVTLERSIYVTDN